MQRFKARSSFIIITGDFKRAISNFYYRCLVIVLPPRVIHSTPFSNYGSKSQRETKNKLFCSIFFSHAQFTHSLALRSSSFLPSSLPPNPSRVSWLLDLYPSTIRYPPSSRQDTPFFSLFQDIQSVKTSIITSTTYVPPTRKPVSLIHTPSLKLTHQQSLTSTAARIHKQVAYASINSPHNPEPRTVSAAGQADPSSHPIHNIPAT